MFLGLCNWADWIGSDERYFEYCDRPCDDYIKTAKERAKQAVDAIGLDPSAQRDIFQSVPGFGNLFGIDGSPNAIQKAATETSLDERLVIIESETGSGKTEAALWRFAKMYEQKLVDGLYFALPTRAAATQIHGRVVDFIKRMMPGELSPDPVLAVPGYVARGRLHRTASARLRSVVGRPPGRRRKRPPLGRGEPQAVPGGADRRRHG